MHVTQHRILVHITQHVSAMSPILVGAPGHLLSPSQRQCWGWRPRESRLRPESSQGPRPPHTLSGNPTPPLEFGEQCESEGTWAGVIPPAISHRPQA